MNKHEIEREVRRLHNCLNAEEDRHKSFLIQIYREIEAIQQQCNHKEKTFCRAKSGSVFVCDYCQKEGV